ncbi:MAG TPA: hypothetical protein PLN25_02685 [Deltaproteobacteria bacterium]|nr:hypothetical protein [Deltaproteobacteria bacterium]HQB37882.1 hypothetical protein [Deltaproteobacteria bacterium]
MPLVRVVIRPLVAAITMLLMGSGLLFSAEIDDSSLFVEAFQASQSRDYLLSIEKIDQLEQLFPDSALRDVSLLLKARAALKAGDNQLAAKSMGRYLSEFSDNPLTAGVEDELIGMAARQRKGEILSPDPHLMVAAEKVRDKRLALARVEAERRERERIAAEQKAREGIKLAISMPPARLNLEVGSLASVPFEITNRGSGREEFLLATQLPVEYGAQVVAADRPGVPLERVKLAGGETLRGMVSFRVPGGKVDGHKINVPVSGVSARFSDLVFRSERKVIAAAPLLRVVTRPSVTKVAKGSHYKYRVVLLNAGSVPASDVTLRVVLPERTELVSARGAGYGRESKRVALFRVDKLPTGRLEAFELEVRALAGRDDKSASRCQVELHNRNLNVKQQFKASF